MRDQDNDNDHALTRVSILLSEHGHARGATQVRIGDASPSLDHLNLSSHTFAVFRPVLPVRIATTGFKVLAEYLQWSFATERRKRPGGLLNFLW